MKLTMYKEMYLFICLFTYFNYLFIFHRLCHGSVESINERIQGTRSPPVNLSVNTDSRSTEVKRDSYSTVPAEVGVVATIKSEVYSNQQQERQSYHHMSYHPSTQEAHSSYGKDEQRSMPDSTFEDSYSGENVVRDFACDPIVLSVRLQIYESGICCKEMSQFLSISVC